MFREDWDRFWVIISVVNMNIVIVFKWSLEVFVGVIVWVRVCYLFLVVVDLDLGYVKSYIFID